MASEPVFVKADVAERQLGVPRVWLLKEADAGRIPSLHLDDGEKWVHRFNVAAVAEVLLKRMNGEAVDGAVVRFNPGDANDPNVAHTKRKPGRPRGKAKT